MMGKYIDLRLFLISLAFGVLLVYLYQPTPTIIYVYPTPDNVNKLLFKDKADNCFKFRANEVKCPEDMSQITTIPIQEQKSK
tara:strand:+ start:3394 stop:3639 length:246 start_codon:yes stop_codon:yes gene_type:complete